MPLDTKDIITLTVACIGAATGISGLGLSIYNTLKAQDKEKIKLEARMSQAVSTAEEGSYLSVEVVNKSAFPITIKHVELVSDSLKERLIDNRILYDVPQRMDPRTSFTFKFMARTFDTEFFDKSDYISIRTADGFELKISDHLDGIKQDVLFRRKRDRQNFTNDEF